MLEKEFYISRLIAVYLQGTASEAEKLQLEKWLAADPKNRSHFETIYQEKQLQEKLQRFQSIDRAAVWGKTMEKMQAQNESFQSIQLERKGFRRGYWLAAAASLAIFFTLGVYFLNGDRQQASQNISQVQPENDVLPGGQGATLTLGNGQRIRLAEVSNGKLAEEYGVKITKSSDGQLIYEFADGDKADDKENVLSTAKGETYQVKLPDGSIVWLNAGSSLSYMTKLVSGGKRMVKLTGEAYFDVKHDRAKPFVVQTAGQTVEVLGTQFNINAYADEPVTTTTLLEGSIKVAAPGFNQVISPGYQSLVGAGQAKVVLADMESSMDWKNGDFVFNQMEFRTAMRKIARWYDVDIIYDVPVSNEMIAAGWIAKDKPLSQVLKSIESSGMVRFKIDGRKIHILK